MTATTISNLFDIVRTRASARRRFWDFCDHIHLALLDPRVKAPWHTVLCDRIQEFVLGDQYDVMVIAVPPGGSKTLLAGRLLVAWLLGIRPRWRILTISNKFDLAEQSGLAIKEMIASSRYQNVFPATRIAANSAAAAEFRTTSRGTFTGLGIDAAVVGRRCELIVLDDVAQGFDSNPAQLVKVNRKYDNEILSRLAPRGKVIIIQQRVDAMDLPGHVLQKMIKNPDGRRVTTFVAPMLCTDPATDPLSRQLDEPLWPEFYTTEMLGDARHDPFSWATNYQQKPPTEIGEFFPEASILTETTPTTRGNAEFVHYIGVDLAYTASTSNDATAIVVTAYHPQTGRAHVVDVYRDRVDALVSSRKIIDMATHWQPVEILFDDDSQTRLYLITLGEQARAAGVPLPVKTLPLGGKDKRLRAMNLQALIRNQRVVIDRSKPWARRLLDELRLFPSGGDAPGCDDQVDALSLLGRRVYQLPRASHADQSAVETYLTPWGETVTRPRGFQKALYGATASLSTSTYGQGRI
jgi:predicted phage terminase large subunit-like protein